MQQWNMLLEGDPGALVIFPADELSPKSVMFNGISLHAFVGALHYGRFSKEQAAPH
jgi:hypothetical protein